MPSIATLVADLNGGTVPGIGGKPDSAVTNSESVLSPTQKLKHMFVHMKASFSASGRLQCEGAATSMSFNGSYVHFQDGWATAGNMDINRTIVASGNFSGCAYKIYRTAPATFKCVHIARPGGANSDALVTSTAAYATANGWTELQSVTTAGLITGGTKEVFIVSQLFPNTRIDTVRLKINNQGLIVGRDLFTSGV